MSVCHHCIHWTTISAWVSGGNKIASLKIESDENGGGLKADASDEKLKILDSHVCKHYQTTFFTMKASCPSRNIG